MVRGLLAAGVAAALLPAAASAAGFGSGVAAGEVTAHSVLLWTRADRPGPVTLELSRDPRFRSGVVRRRATAAAARDLSVRLAVRGLRPGTAYAYRFRQGRRTSPIGRFRTAPPAGADAPVSFAVSGDADATPAPGRTAPYFNRFQVYARMAAEGNDFNLNVGDTIYSDSEIAGVPPALTRRAKWGKYRQNLALPALRRLRAATGLYSHWDDHEFVNDFSRPEHGETLYRAGVEAFTDYAPVRYTERDGLYRTVRWGRNVELFFLDQRSFRDAKVSSEGVCGTPPDLAPTAPIPVRQAFAALAPALAQPVPQACLDRIRDPSRTMLGARQYAAFTRAIARSTATWKVIVNEVPMQQFYALPYDRWEGYEAERTRLLEFLQANVRNVLFLTTDTHANLVGEVRLRTLEPEGPLSTGILEAITGPVATNTYAKEIDEVLHAPGSGALIEALFLKPQPPRGIGMQCAATDVYSYAQVRATRTTLTITPKDLHGRPVRERSGAPCGPFVLRAE